MDREEKTPPARMKQDPKNWVLDGNKVAKGWFVRISGGKLTLVDEKGARLTIPVSQISESDRKYAEMLEKSMKDQLEKIGEVDASRTSWNNVSYSAKIDKWDDRLWVQTESKTRRKTHFVYLTHTKDYVELFNPTNRDILRLHAGKLEADVPKQWTTIGAGNWEVK